jgi:hypothetical protein
MELPVVQLIINHKWHRYTRSYFLKQFFILMAFIIFFIGDLILTSPLYRKELRLNLKYKLNYACHAVCWLSMLYFAIYILRGLRKQGFARYFSGPNLGWHIFDCLFQLVYLAYLLIVYFLPKNLTIMTVWRSIQCAIIVLMFIKLNQVIRIFEGMSFMVQMIPAVVYELQHFLFYFLLFIITFGLFLLTLLME